MDLKGLQNYIEKRIEQGLPHFVIYHGIDHTHDVHAAVIRLAELENLDEYNTTLVRAAALLHDSGITVKFEEHEEISAEIAANCLPQFGFNNSEILQITSMILATKLPQVANTINERILCDADLDYLGRIDFFVIGQKLRLEWELIGNKISLFEWYRLQMEFLKNHRYFTKSARFLRNERKNLNLAEIQQFFVKAGYNK